MNLVFGNPGWLGFAVLALGPLVIHFLYKRRVRVVRWPHVALLSEVRRENRRSLRLREVLLLVLRTVAVLSVVLAVSRPVLAPRGVAVAEGGVGGHRSLVFVLDNSLSMGLSENGVTLLDEAVLRAGDILRSVHRPGDAVAVVASCGAEAVYEEVYDSEEALRRMREVRLCGGSGSVLDALRTVESFASGGERLVYVLSDFQRSVWSNAGYGGGRGMRVVLVSLARKGRANVVVEGVRPPLVFPGAGPGGRLRAVLRNTGDAAVEVTVGSYQDGRKTGEERVRLAGGASAEVEFPWHPGRPGLTVGFVGVEGDRLRADNRRWFAVRMPERMRVVLVDDTGGEASRFLRKVFEVAGSGFLEVVRTESSGLAQVLGGADVVVLAGFRRLPAGTAEVLVRHVGRGGGVWVATEAGLDLEGFNGVFHPVLVPCRLLGRAVVSAPEEVFGVRSWDVSHPLLAAFEGTDLFRNARFRGYYRAAVEEGDARLQVLARMETGDPLLVEYVHRSSVSEREVGRVLVWFSSLSDGLSAFPYTMNYPAFVLQVLRHLVERPVEEFVLPVWAAGVAGRLGVAADGGVWRWVDGRWERWVGEVVEEGGVWRLGGEVFVVRTPPEESEVVGMSEEELRRVFRGAVVVRGGEGVGRRAGEAEAGRSLTPWVLVLALGCLLAESLVLGVFRREAEA